jgi:hypothetical protein
MSGTPEGVIRRLLAPRNPVGWLAQAFDSNTRFLSLEALEGEETGPYRYLMDLEEEDEKYRIIYCTQSPDVYE